MREPWVRTALTRLPDTRSCPACAATLRSSRCDRCLLDLTGPLAFEIAAASTEAADALERRQRALDALRTAQPDAAAWARSLAAPPAAAAQRTASPSARAWSPAARTAPGAQAQAPGSRAPGSPVARPHGPGTAGSPARGARPPAGGPGPSPSGSSPGVPAAPNIGLQPVLATAGAGLLAVSVVVFVFFMFGDALVLRALGTGVVTVLTVGAAVVLRRAGLRSSAEAVAALAVVLALVDAELALQAGLLAAADPAFARAVVLGVVVLVLGVVGDRARVRAWVTSAVVLAPLVPLLAALAGHGAPAWTVGLLAAALTTVLAGVVARRSGPRLSASFDPERRLAQLGRAVSFPVAVLVALTAGGAQTTTGRAESAGLVLVCALVAVLLRLLTHERAWLAAAGVTVLLAAGLLGMVEDLVWIGLVPAFAAVGWLALVAVSTPRLTAVLRRGRPLAAASRADVLLAGWVSLVVLGSPALLGLPARVLDVLGGAAAGPAVALGRASLGGDVWWTESFDGSASVFRAGALVSAVHLGVLALLVVALVAARADVGSTAHAAGADLGSTAHAAGAAGAGGAARAGGEAHSGGGSRPVTTAGRGAAPWLALTLLLGLALDPRLAGVASLVLLVVLAVGLLLAATGRRGAAATAGSGPARWRTVAVTGVFVATALVLAGSWTSRPTAAAGAVVVGALLLAARRAVPRAARAPLVGVAYAYVLVVLGVSLGWLGLDGVAALCTVAAVAAVTALVVTLVRSVGRDTWWAVLAVTAVPFVLGVGTVVTERSWWAVAACVAMLALEVVLVLARRPGTVLALRVGGAGLALPTASVAVVSAGAMLVPGSGSPVVLPVVAALVAAVAAAARAVAGVVAARSERAAARPVREVLELSAGVTGAIAVVLAFARPAAGAEVAVAVLLLLAVGAGLVARAEDRRGAWWLAAALTTAASWTALAAAGIGLVEAYTAPPAVAAIVVGVVLSRRPAARRHRRALDLATAGAVLVVAPSVLVLVARTTAGDVRAPVLTAAGGALVLAAAAVARRRPLSPAWSRTAALRLCAVAVLAASAGTVEAFHVARVPGGGPAFALGAAWALAAGAVAYGAGALAARTTPARWRSGLRRWACAPALLLAVAGVVAGVRPVWGVIAAVWAVEIVLLVLLVVGVRRALRGLHDLPPAWFTWLLALAAAIGAWSPRELRVEVFSLPLGAGLLVAGALALVAAAPGAGTVDARAGRGVRSDGGGTGSASGSGAAVAAAGIAVGSAVGGVVVRGPWPIGRVGSWALLAPGILATLGPSVLATYTDARTWRAMLVVALALVAVLVGTRRHLAAPFLLGVGVLPVEILVVFVSQLGTRISAGLWMLTLAAAGGLLLIIATYYERRISAYDGAAAYVRDLR